MAEVQPTNGVQVSDAGSGEDQIALSDFKKQVLEILKFQARANGYSATMGSPKLEGSKASICQAKAYDKFKNENEEVAKDFDDVHPLERRGEALQKVQELLPKVLKLSRSSWIVKSSNRSGDYSYVPWVSVSNAEHKTNVSKGWQVVYLFSWDGQRMVLSLSQGSDNVKTEDLFEKAREARGQLLKRYADGFREGPRALKDEIELGYASKKYKENRPEKYQHANVYTRLATRKRRSPT